MPDDIKALLVRELDIVLLLETERRVEDAELLAVGVGLITGVGMLDKAESVVEELLLDDGI